MKIALFNYSSSGLFHYAASLANALAQSDKVSKIVFFTSSQNNTALIKPHPKVEFIAQEAPHSLLSLLGWCFNPRAQKMIRDKIKDFNPDVIHINDTFPVYPLHYLLLKKYPTVFTQHDPTIHTGDAYSLPTRLIQNYLQRVSRRIVVHGETLKNSLASHTAISLNKISSVPLGDFSILLAGKNLATAPIPRSILFFGRVVKYKGLDTLLKSLLQLQRDKINFHLIIAGPGNLDAYQNDLAQIKHKTIVNNYIPDAEVLSYFKRSEIMVLPYHEATQSAAAALGLAAGLPIIASRVGALPEVLKDNYNSLLVEPGNQHALSEKIAYLLNDKKLQQELAANARHTADTKLSWTAVSQKYISIYNKAINAPGL